MRMTGMDELTFEQATQDEVKELLLLMSLLYEHDGQFFDVAHALRGTVELILTPDAGAIWLLQSEGRTVGYCVLTFGFSIEFGGRDALVDELFLLPGHRGKGWGKLALEFMFEQCRAAGVRAVHVDVNLVNEHALSVYRHLGFVQPERRRMTKWI
jgi:diamine N-acetyltransferase